MKLVFFMFTLTFALPAYSAPAWYYGEITRVWHYNDDGFIVTLDSLDLSDCKHNYAYFKASIIGRDQERSLYSMALSAFHTHQKVGVVIDKQGPGEYCEAKSMHMKR